jgi:transposase
MRSWTPAGLEVYLVNARHTKNLPGRKSDVQESQWLLKLHTYGLLRNSFHPPADIRVVRTYWRHAATMCTASAPVSSGCKKCSPR